MKRILFCIAMISSVYLSAQTVIIDEKYTDNSKPVDFRYLPNSKKFIIMKGKTISMGAAPFIYEVFSFDTDGKKEVIIEKDELMEMTYSSTENSFKAYDASKGKFNAKFDCKYFLNNKYEKAIPFADLEELGDFHFGTVALDNRIGYYRGRSKFSHFSNSFNDFFELGLTNQKGKEKIDFEKDDLYLEVLDIQSSTKNRFKIEKPNLTLLKGDSYVKFEEDIHFNCILNGNENFDLIAKSLSSDSKKIVIYKNTYDFKGNKIKEVSFNLELDNKYFICSDISGGIINYTGGVNNGPIYTLFDALSLNNFYQDKKNGDIYVYGIFTNSVPYHKHRKSEKPSGFYIFKFDKEGNKIWESVNEIDDEKYFEKIRENGNLDVSLVEYFDNLLFSISVNDFTEFTHTMIIDKRKGEILKRGKMVYNNNNYIGGGKFFIRPTYESKDEFRNKSFSQVCFAALTINENYLNYIKGLPLKGDRKYFETIFSDQGIWLIETDNEEYYKVLLFKE
ncbi:hypothetical protein [Flavobacterium sp.]|uniref:hypothetical protein n=1 Tax=Flavobacterium sp. TaxID=239 RepID=UPI0031CDAF98